MSHTSREKLDLVNRTKKVIGQLEAVLRALNEDGRNAFAEYQVPEAVLALKQGFGRLIRSRTDRGVLALLDNRITKTRYGQIFFDSLPPYRFTTSRQDVEKFFNARNT